MVNNHDEGYVMPFGRETLATLLCRRSPEFWVERLNPSKESFQVEIAGKDISIISAGELTTAKRCHLNVGE